MGLCLLQEKRLVCLSSWVGYSQGLNQLNKEDGGYEREIQIVTKANYLG